MSESPFVIDQVSWHMNTPGNTESRAHMTARFWAVTDFLQRNGLANRTLAASPTEISDSFALRSDDLTPQGLELMRKAYDKWLAKVDDGLEPNDVSILEKQLRKIA